MQRLLTELEAEFELAALGLESEAPEHMAGTVRFCQQSNCGGVLRNKGRKWVCPVCGGSDDGAGDSTAGTVGPPQGHRGRVSKVTHDKHTKRRPGAPEKKDRRQKESELAGEMASAAAALEFEFGLGRRPVASMFGTSLEQELEAAAYELESKPVSPQRRGKSGRRSPRYRCPNCGAFHGAGPRVLCRDCHVKKWGPDVPWPPR